MRLQSISATNLKGKTFTYQLGAGTAIIGPNFAGKTAVLDAIVLLFKGYIPAVGKTAKATWELCSGDRLDVHGDFGDGDYLEKGWWLEGGTVKYAAEGRIPEMNDIPLLDAEQYFGMTDRERTNYVFARIKLPEIYTADAIIAELEQISFEEAHSEQIQKAKTHWMPVLAKYFKDASIQDALEAAVDGLKDSFTHWNRRSKETQGAVKTMTELKLREKEISTDSIDLLKKEMAIVQGELQGLVETKGRLTEQRDQVAKNTTAIHLLESRLAAASIDYDEKARQVEALITKLRKQIGPTPKIGLGQLKQIRKELADKISTRAAVISHGQSRMDEIEKQLASLAEAKACPTCKAKAKGWKAAVEKELTASFEVGRVSLDELRKADSEENVELTAIDDDILNEESRIEVSRENLSKILDAERDLLRIASEKQADAERRADWNRDLLERKGWVAPTMENGLDEIERDRVRAAAKLAGLRERHDAAFALQHDIRRASEAQIEHRQAAAHVAVIKRIQSVLSDRKNTIVDDVFGALLVTANRIFGSIFQTPLTLHNDTVGRWSHEGKFIPHRVFSGTEKALAYIAIATALSSQAPIRIPMLDEFGRLDSDNQADVLAQLLRAVREKLIDQFIVVGTTIPSIGTDLTVIQMKP